MQNIEDAEEVTQDVFITIYQKIDGFKTESKLSTWIYRIAVNAALNRLKKKQKKSFLNLTTISHQIPHFEHPGIIAENKENASILFKAIYQLPESQKTAFILSYIEELPRQEVADIMGNSLKSIESLLQRGKQNLRKLLKSYIETEGNEGISLSNLKRKK